MTRMTGAFSAVFGVLIPVALLAQPAAVPTFNVLTVYRETV